MWADSGGDDKTEGSHSRVRMEVLAEELSQLLVQQAEVSEGEMLP